MNSAKLTRMLEAEVAADKWWDSLSDDERKAYLEAHPLSKLAQDHTAHPFHKVLEKHGYVYDSSQNAALLGNPRNGTYTEHLYKHPNPNNSSTVRISAAHQEPRTGSKYFWQHRGQQKNGLMAPSTGETKPGLDKRLTQWASYDAQ